MRSESLRTLVGRLDDLSLDAAIRAAWRGEWERVEAVLARVRGRRETRARCDRCRGLHPRTMIQCPTTRRAIHGQTSVAAARERVR